MPRHFTKSIFFCWSPRWWARACAARVSVYFMGEGGGGQGRADEGERDGRRSAPNGNSVNISPYEYTLQPTPLPTHPFTQTSSTPLSSPPPLTLHPHPHPTLTLPSPHPLVSSLPYPLNYPTSRTNTAMHQMSTLPTPPVRPLTRHSASRLGQAMSSWSATTRRATYRPGIARMRRSVVLRWPQDYGYASNEYTHARLAPTAAHLSRRRE